MRTFTLLLTALLFSLPLIHAQNLSFNRTYGGVGYDDARGLVPTADGGFVFTGLTKSGADTFGDMYLTKINAAGAVLWQRFYGQPKEDGGNAVINTRDGGFLISGHVADNYGVECNGYIVKTDAAGNEQWRKFVGTTYDDVCTGALQTQEGDFFFTGRVEDHNLHRFDVMLCKIQEDGTYGFLKTLGTPGDDFGYKIAETPDGQLLIAGYSVDEDSHKEGIYLVKCDKDGLERWHLKAFESTGLHMRAYGVLPLENGNTMIAGGIAGNTGTGDMVSAFVALVDATGQIITFKRVLENIGASYGFCLSKTGADEYSVAGALTLPGEVVSQPLVFQVNDNLAVLDYQTGANKQASQTVDLVKISNNDFLMVGKQSWGDHNTDILVTRVQNNANTAVEDLETRPYTLFPNPMTEYTYLKLENAPYGMVLRLFSMDGQNVGNYPFIGDELVLYRNNLASGSYLFKIEKSNGTLFATGKLMIK